MIYIGTSGYSYDDWIGTFYDAEIKKSQMLEAYSKQFNFTEINSTYYSIPSPYVSINLVKKTPVNFKFTVKLHNSMTHQRNATEEQYKSFYNAVEPLIASNKLGCLVAQFPYSFHHNKENMDYIINIKDKFANIPLCVEFRNNYWMNTETYKKLAKENIGFVCVDEPDVQGLIKKAAVVTSNIGYIRFHGRNKEKWYNHKNSYERYDYLYDKESLKEWIHRIKFIEEKSETTFIAFNNHFRGQGAVNANMLIKILHNNI